MKTIVASNLGKYGNQIKIHCFSKNTNITQGSIGHVFPKTYSLMVSDIVELYFRDSSKVNKLPSYFKSEKEFLVKINTCYDRLKYIKCENWGMTEEYYFNNGLLHCLWGPAISFKFKDIQKQSNYFVEGKEYTEDEYWKLPLVRRFTRKLKLLRSKQ
jgi:hypothetical protein